MNLYIPYLKNGSEISTIISVTALMDDNGDFVGSFAMLVIQAITCAIVNEANRRYYAKRKRQSFHKGQGMIRI